MNSSINKINIILFCNFLLIIVSFFVTYNLFAKDIDIEKIREEILLKNAKWEASPNWLTNLDERELNQIFSLKIDKSKKTFQNEKQYLISNNLSSYNLPKYWDWRDVNSNNYVTSIKNQGKCGACYAFATAAVLESYYLISNNTPNIEIDLSEQFMISCGKVGDCIGGYIQKASDYLLKHGIPPESCLPYRQLEIECFNACPNWGDNLYKIDNWIFVSEGPATPEMLKKAIVEYGPLVTVMDVQSDFLSYKSGIYKYVWGRHLGGHAVVIVGYNDDEQYFIVKNSSGAEWGEGGYFRIAYSELKGPVDFGYITLAYYKNLNRVTINKTGNGIVYDNLGKINCGSVCSAEYPAGSQITLFASGENFRGWEGEGCTGTGECFTEIFRTKNITARFGYDNITFKSVAKFSQQNRHSVVALDDFKKIIYTNDLINWRTITNSPKIELTVGDINRDFSDDICAISQSEDIFCTTDLINWQKISGKLSFIISGDLNGDSKSDLCGINSKGNIFYTTDLINWNNIPGEISLLSIGDFNGDGKSDISGINSNGYIYYTTDLRTWTNIPGELTQLVIGDFNGDGKSDIAGLNSQGYIYFTNNLRSWNNIPGNLSKLITGDFNGDGKSDICGINSGNHIYCTLDMLNWINIPGNFFHIITGDFNGDGKFDILALGIDGKLYYTTDLSKWNHL